jgi:Fe-S cluster assembly iron-binding protein IscA
LALDEPKDNDESVSAGDQTFVIDQQLSEQLGEVKVDFVEEGWRSGFMVSSENPVNAGPSACGGSCSC